MARRRWNLKTIEEVLDGGNPFIQVGYTPESTVRKEGDTWTDSKGKKFIRKDGRNVRVNSSDTPLLDAINTMSKCSECGMNVKNYGNALDRKVFPKTQMCYDCLETKEMIYRATGRWEQYEQMKILKNRRSSLKFFKEKVLESIDFLSKETGKIKETMPDGSELVFSGTSNPQWLIDANDDLVKVTAELEKIDKEIEDYEATLTV